ncbi:hypothetical protein CAEBREN_25362 [Caenorhabditis brenneri]|uniref:F-box domain-containing protein n=1 Tax=Caenorhabditis brenneri TaxID=135651 RepID=G0NPI2_CAEBE|nr:hypothetical protein CAEBREN_25362 [Caenorhabditis brenneri]
MGFPILKIPFVALKVLLDHLTIVELVTVSLLSKRADWFLKACGKKNVSFFNLPNSEIRNLSDFEKLELFLLESRRQRQLPEWRFKLFCSVSSDRHIKIGCTHFCIEIYIETLYDMRKFAGIRKSLKIGDSLIPVVVTRGYVGVERIRAFAKSNTDGMIVFIDYFKKRFNFSIEKLELAERNAESIKTVVNYLNSTQAVVRNVECYPPLSEKDFILILRNVSATEKFSSYLKLSWNFKFKETIRAKNIEIRLGHWFTIENLLMSNESEVIHVSGSDYTKKELRWFLKKWREGKLPKLKEVILATKVSCWDALEGCERWEGACRKCDGWPGSVVIIKGHGDSHGCFHASDRNSYRMLIHDN